MYFLEVCWKCRKADGARKNPRGNGVNNTFSTSSSAQSSSSSSSFPSRTPSPLKARRSSSRGRKTHTPRGRSPRRSPTPPYTNSRRRRSPHIEPRREKSYQKRSAPASSRTDQYYRHSSSKPVYRESYQRHSPRRSSGRRHDSKNSSTRSNKHTHSDTYIAKGQSKSYRQTGPDYHRCYAGHSRNDQSGFGKWDQDRNTPLSKPHDAKLPGDRGDCLTGSDRRHSSPIREKSPSNLNFPSTSETQVTMPNFKVKLPKKISKRAVDFETDSSEPEVRGNQLSPGMDHSSDYESNNLGKSGKQPCRRPVKERLGARAESSDAENSENERAPADFDAASTSEGHVEITEPKKESRYRNYIKQGSTAPPKKMNMLQTRPSLEQSLLSPQTPLWTRKMTTDASKNGLQQTGS